MKRLTNLRGKEISLTKAGANRRLFLTYKSADKGQEPMADPKPAQELRTQLEAVEPAICAQLDAIVKSATDMGNELSPRAASVLKAIGRLVTGVSGEITPDQMLQVCRAAGVGVPDADAAADAMGKVDKPVPPSKKEDEEASDEEEEEAEEEGEDEDDEEEFEEDDDEADEKKATKSAKIAPASNLGEHRSNATPAAAPAKARIQTEPEGGSVDKKEKQPVEKAESFDDLRKSNAELKQAVALMQKQAEERDKAHAAERRERALGDLHKSVTENFGHLGVDADKVAPALFALKESGNADHYNAVVDVLEKSREYKRRVEGPAGLFKAFGKSGSAAPVSKSAEDELEELTRDEMKKSENSKRSFAQVYRDVGATARGKELRHLARAQARGEV